MDIYSNFRYRIRFGMIATSCETVDIKQVVTKI